MFNWFSKKQIAITYGLLSVVSAAANIVMTEVDRELVTWRYVIGGTFMFLFAALDWRWFKFYPLEAGIFIDVSGRNKDDLALF